MKHSDFAHRWTMLLLLLIGLTTPLSASHANSQIVVFDAPPPLAAPYRALPKPPPMRFSHG